MYFLAPRIRFRVLLACALMWASASVIVGRAIAETVNASVKADRLVTSIPVSRPCKSH